MLIFQWFQWNKLIRSFSVMLNSCCTCSTYFSRHQGCMNPKSDNIYTKNILFLPYEQGKSDVLGKDLIFSEAASVFLHFYSIFLLWSLIYCMSVSHLVLQFEINYRTAWRYQPALLFCLAFKWSFHILRCSHVISMKHIPIF